MAGLLDGVLPYLYSRGDWAKRQLGGLLSDPLGSVEQTAGGLLDSARTQQGLLAQAFANKARPLQVTDSGALGQAVDSTMAGPMGFAPAGITAWHGSPHVFDKFDSSKIGSGEGAQAYGHGLYLAESPDVAKSYQSTGAKFAPSIDGKSVLESYSNGTLVSQLAAKAGLSRDDAVEAAQLLADSARTGAPLADLVSQKAQRAAQMFGPEEAARLQELGKRIGSVAPNPMPGGLYKVDLPDSAVAKMLDWDKPLSQQAPEVQGAIEQLKPSMSPAWQKAINSKTSGESLHIAIGSATNKTTDAAARLREAGIPGIRYLDGGSRGAGQGSSNFVVFPGEESLLQILERNGQPLGR